MFKVLTAVILMATIVLATPEAKPEAKPGVFAAAAAPIAYTSPLISAPYVAAHSSQVIARNYNGLYAAATPLAAYTVPAAAGAAYIASPYAAAYSPYIAGAPLKYTLPAPVLL